MRLYEISEIYPDFMAAVDDGEILVDAVSYQSVGVVGML